MQRMKVCMQVFCRQLPDSKVVNTRRILWVFTFSLILLWEDAAGKNNAWGKCVRVRESVAEYFSCVLDV